MSELIEQLDLFGEINPKFKLDKPILLIEMFGGIGSQAKALEILGIPFKHHKLVEWAYNSYVMYNMIHQKDFTDYSEGKTKEEMLERIKGTSTNYNEPLTMEQLKRKPIEWIKKAYNSCIATNNLVDISQVKGEDLDFDDNVNQTIILTYSFPCQDLSLAGTLGGLSKDEWKDGNSTRSGLLWEVERILDERIRGGLPLPNVLLMENVANLLSQNFIGEFQNWEQKLASIGYSNFVKVLNAKEYGIPQNRERVFMISILGDYHYSFPLKIDLKYRLKDFLTKKVDEKYYLSEKMIDYISQTGTKDFSVNNAIINKDIARPLTTEQNKRAGTTNYFSNDLPPNIDLQTIRIRNATKKGYLEAKEGDGINLSTRMEYQRGNVQKESIQTIKTDGGSSLGVVVKNK